VLGSVSGLGSRLFRSPSVSWWFSVCVLDVVFCLGFRAEAFEISLSLLVVHFILGVGFCVPFCSFGVLPLEASCSWIKIGCLAVARKSFVCRCFVLTELLFVAP